ncbi:MAG: signal peptidase II, partial [Syntrophales bacterium]|nr:signal peptidase II [Syntrophales bacterium]
RDVRETCNGFCGGRPAAGGVHKSMRRTMQKRNILFLAITVLVVLLDQATKVWIISTLGLHEGFPLIDGFFSIVHVRNPGAAFGFLAGAPPLFRYLFFIAVTVAAIALILHYLRVSRIEVPSLVSALALILAGAVGNLIDRIRFGEVVDFLDVYIGGYHWPAFNVADSAITVGAGVLMAVLLRKRKERTEVN